jgi:hypothetical protein
LAAGRKRPAKHADALRRARELVSVGRYRDTRHSSQRRGERGIILPEIIQAILSGWHEKRKDEFKPEWNSWNYAIRGKTVDDRELRVAVAFEERASLLILVTAIDLGARESDHDET